MDRAAHKRWLEHSQHVLRGAGLRASAGRTAVVELLGRQIALLTAQEIADRLREERGVELEVEPGLVARLAREGFDEAFGARPLKRHVRRTLEKELTRAILDGRIGEGSQVLARLAGDEGAIALDVVPAVAPLPAAA